MELDNRELAAIILSALFGAWLFWFAVRDRDVRRAFRDLLASLLSLRLLVPFIAYGGWVALLVLGAERIGLWTAGFSFPLVAWFFAVGLPLMFKLAGRKRDKPFLRPIVRRSLELTVLVEFLVGLAVFSLWMELLLGVAAAFLLLLSAVAGTRDEFAQIKRYSEGLLGALGTVLVLYALGTVVGAWGSLDHAALLRELALPIWLTVGVLPYLYLVSLYSGYELIFVRVGLADTSARAKRRAKIGIVLALQGRTAKVNAFAGGWPYRLVEADSVRGAQRVGEDFLRDLARRDREKRARAERLERFAGVDGVDKLGRRLDQREFQVTQRALRQLADAQIGWYRRLGRYRDDLHELFPFTDLPEDHGVHMRVANGGRTWYAWRRTVTGWCFAAGATGPPPSRFSYDGVDPPAGFPGSESGWVDAITQQEGANWDLAA